MLQKTTSLNFAEMRNKQPISKQVFPVHRVIGRYEVDGTITFIAPASLPAEITETLVNEQVQTLVREKMLADMFHEDRINLWC